MSKQDLDKITEQDEILNSLLKPEKTSHLKDDNAIWFRKIGGQSIFTRCCGQGMTKLKAYIRYKTPKGVEKEFSIGNDLFYCHSCGLTHQPAYVD